MPRTIRYPCCPVCDQSVRPSKAPKKLQWRGRLGQFRPSFQVDITYGRRSIKVGPRYSLAQCTDPDWIEKCKGAVAWAAYVLHLISEREYNAIWGRHQSYEANGVLTPIAKQLHAANLAARGDKLLLPVGRERTVKGAKTTDDGTWQLEWPRPDDVVVQLQRGAVKDDGTRRLQMPRGVVAQPKADGRRKRGRNKYKVIVADEGTQRLQMPRREVEQKVVAAEVVDEGTCQLAFAPKGR